MYDLTVLYEKVNLYAGVFYECVKNYIYERVYHKHWQVKSYNKNLYNLYLRDRDGTEYNILIPKGKPQWIVMSKQLALIDNKERVYNFFPGIITFVTPDMLNNERLRIYNRETNKIYDITELNEGESLEDRIIKLTEDDY